MAANKLSTLTILLWNANGISNNTNELQITLKENNVDIALITESHLTSNSKFKIYGYDCLQANHPDDSAHAGAALLISSKIPHSPFPPKSNQNMQLAATPVIINSIPTSIISVYFHPSCQFPAENVALYLRSLNNTYIIGADFNAKYEACGCRSTNTRGRTLHNFISNKRSKTISPASPTYWPSHTNRHPDFLDFFLSNLPNHIHTNITNINDPASDHTPVILKIRASIDFCPRTKIRADWNKFRNAISTLSSLNISLKNSDDIDNAVSILTKNIQDTIQASNTTYPAQENHNINITPEIKELIRLKRRARNTWQRSHYPIDKQRYNYYSNKLKSTLKKHRNHSYATHLQFLSSSNGSLWKKTKSLLKHKTVIPPLRYQNNNLAITPKEKSELLASHLANTFKPHNISPDTPHLLRVEEFISSPLPMAPPASPTSPGEVLSVIKKLKKNKSPGHNGINNSTVKNLPPKTIILLTYIFNAIFRLSYFPNSWKSAMIITIPKPGKPPDTPESYRPISLLPTLGKIFEKILLKKLTAIAIKQNALPDFQFGFRANHATFHQLHKVVDYIATTLETKKYCSGLFLDVAQAFDTVWHHGLLQTISAGVPQGSDIAPFLYTLFTADIPTSVNTLIGTYADDTAVLSSSHDINEANLQLRNHLDILSHWFKSWKIKVNDSKSAHVTFALLPGAPPPLTFNSKTIPQTNEVKYLGLLFDKRLTWGPHLKNKRKQLNSRLHILRPLLKSKISISNRLLLYKSLLLPIWSYGIALWGSAKPANTRTIQAFQAICLRMTVNAPWYVTNVSLHNELKIATVKQTAAKFYTRLHSTAADHPNCLIAQLHSNHLPENPPRRLKRNWPRDLLNT
ncbi:hypothetical protein QTP88_021597 [Uroleucon formosanum]